MTDLPFRRSCRGLLVSDCRILLAEHDIGLGNTVWVGPGGGVKAGEGLVDALTRELHEETGIQITEEHAPLQVWVQTAKISEMHVHGYAGVINHYFLIGVEPFVPVSGVDTGESGHPEREGILDQRWWTISEIEAAHSEGVLFSPRDLPRLLHSLFWDGPPSSAIAIGL